MAIAPNRSALDERPWQRLHALGPEQRDEVLVGQQTAQGVDDEEQAGLAQRRPLDQQLLPLRFLAIRTDQASRPIRAFGCASVSRPPWLSPLPVALRCSMIRRIART